jgi:hypothetical protein
MRPSRASDDAHDGVRRGPAAATGPSDDLARLRRWEDAGGTWQVLSRRPGAVIVALCRCDGGEEADRFGTADPRVLAYLAGRDRSEG